MTTTTKYVALGIGAGICFSLGFTFGPYGVLVAMFVAMFLGYAVIE